MEDGKIAQEQQGRADGLYEDDYRELVDEELEGVAGGAGYEKSPFRCRDCHYVFFAPSTFEHYICPECNGPSDRVK